jgi:hypothetical protein
MLRVLAILLLVVGAMGCLEGCAASIGALRVPTPEASESSVGKNT